MIILGIDPGTTNTGICISEFNSDELSQKPEVLHTEVIKGNIPNISIIESLIKEYGVTDACIEKYVYYGIPTDNEDVNRFIGGIEWLLYSNNIPYNTVKAVEWQYYLRLKLKLKKSEISKSYKSLAKKLFNLTFKTEHEADGLFLGLYYFYQNSYK